MTRGSIQEYTEAVRERYLWAGKKEKGKYWTNLLMSRITTANQLFAYYAEANDLRQANSMGVLDVMELLWSRH